jgi:hypothetical protein
MAQVPISVIQRRMETFDALPRLLRDQLNEFWADPGTARALYDEVSKETSRKKAAAWVAANIVQSGQWQTPLPRHTGRPRSAMKRRLSPDSHPLAPAVPTRTSHAR